MTRDTQASAITSRPSPNDGGGHDEQFHRKLFDELERTLGPTGWWPAETPFEVFVGAILTQNARWTGVVKAIATLKDTLPFTAEAIACAPHELIAEALRPTIYYNQKAHRLKDFCLFLVREFAGDVENMNHLDSTTAREKLLALKGIGCETADSMLLYALKNPVFVVDAYTRRILSRHGLMDAAASYEDIRSYFEQALPPDPVMYAEYHGLLCIVGSRWCAPKPRCDECPIREYVGEPLP